MREYLQTSVLSFAHRNGRGRQHLHQNLSIIAMVFLLSVSVFLVPSQASAARIIRLVAGVRLHGGVRLGGSSPISSSAPSTLGNGLVGYWSFDTSDVSGTTITDLSGSSNTGTAAETPTLVTGHLNKSLALTDGIQEINVGHGSSLNITGPFSVSFWLFPTTTPGAVDYAPFQKAQSYKGTGFGAYYGYSSTQINCSINSAVVVTSSANMNLNQWNHIVCLYDGSHFKVYLNGTQTGTIANSTNPASSASDNLYLGSGGLDSGLHFFGDMDEFRIYNRALTSSEITQLYNQ